MALENSGYDLTSCPLYKDPAACLCRAFKQTSHKWLFKGDSTISGQSDCKGKDHFSRKIFVQFSGIVGTILENLTKGLGHLRFVSVDGGTFKISGGTDSEKLESFETRDKISCIIIQERRSNM